MWKSEHQVGGKSALFRKRPALQEGSINCTPSGPSHFPRGTTRRSKAARTSVRCVKTVEIVQKLRKDVREVRVAIAAPHVAGDNAPLISTPTATVKKRTPGQTIPGDFRLISDLRFPNFPRGKSGYVEVKWETFACFQKRRAL